MTHNAKDFTFKEKKDKKFSIRKGKITRYYLPLHCGFDIETTNIINDDVKHAYMYHWQFSIDNDVILGRTWEEFEDFIKRFIEFYIKDKNTYILIWIANAGFEFQFMRKHFNITSLFAKELRHPIMFEIDGCLEFRDCLSLTGGNLEFLAKNYTNTKKLVGDLDYSIERSYLTPLTQKEIDYCVNDVKILAEFSEYCFSEYFAKHQDIPLTKTSIVRKKVKKNILDMESVNNVIKACYPSESFYKIIMNWLYRGGFVHANIKYTGVICKDVASIDFTSSYPSALLEPYPMGKFEDTELADLNDISDKYAYIVYAEFKDIKAKTNHTIESRHKLIESDNCVYDNGRLYSAKSIKVMLTEYDIMTYNLFYEWSSCRIIRAWKCIKAMLPNYLLTTLFEEYTKKANLKISAPNSLDLMIAKGNVNSIYGMCCTRLYESDIAYNNDEWQTVNADKTFNEQIDNVFLLPYWGIWCSSIARYNLLSMVALIDNDVVYCDTDSIKFMYAEKHKPIIEAYNHKMMQRNIDICKKYNLEIEDYYNLGCFDWEETSKEFCTLGAKRYITKSGHKFKSTISGLKKQTLEQYAKDVNQDPFDIFKNGLYIPKEYTLKLTSCYNDEEHTDIVAGVPMTELSSCALYEIPFSLTLTGDYLRQIEAMIERGVRGKI